MFVWNKDEQTGNYFCYYNSFLGSIERVPGTFWYSPTIRDIEGSIAGYDEILFENENLMYSFEEAKRLVEENFLSMQLV